MAGCNASLRVLSTSSLFATLGDTWRIVLNNMGKSDSTVIVCKCSAGSPGSNQMLRTARSHYDRDDERFGWPTHWSRTHPGQVYILGPAVDLNEGPLGDSDEQAAANPTTQVDALDEEATEDFFHSQNDEDEDDGGQR
ncbi:hypothetical protein K525DRAFT_275595 [Schizophyllum commune Loenen D]|nr:hypothetical protein K525DRAFT_275595 [Schizophyllum commune Loenen D]